MSRSEFHHPDYLAAPERQRYARGPLMGLWVLLNQELLTKPPGIWCGRVLPSGALVSLKCELQGARVLRIARSERFKTDRGPQNWETELATFLKHFGEPLRWKRRDEKAETGGPAAWYYEAEAEPERAPEPEQGSLL